MNYEAAERAMNQKRLRMEGEPGHGVVQGNGLPLNYIDNGHQIAYQPYAGAYNTHYHPPDAFAAYPPPPGGYAPQNLSYVPPAHQNYPHHQSFAQQPQQLHMQSHMGLPSLAVQGYGDVHKSWAPQPHLLPPLDAVKPLDVKQLKPEIKVEPTDAMKRPLQDEIMGGDLDQPKIKIKTDIFKPDDVVPRPEPEKPHDATSIAPEAHKPEALNKEEAQPSLENKTADKPTETAKPEGAATSTDTPRPADSVTPDKSQEDRKPFSSPDLSKQGISKSSSGDDMSPKKRGRPKGSTNKPKPPTPTPRMPGAVQGAGGAGGVRPPAPRLATPQHRPRAQPYQYSVRQFRKDFSGIQFRRRWSDDCLDSSHIPNEVYFGDVPVSMEVLFNYYDANAERERLAAQAAHIAAQKAAAAKLAAAKLQARGLIPPEIRGKVTTVDSSSSDESDSDDSDSNDSDDETPVKKTPKPKGTGTGKRGRPPVPPELREPGITDMKRFCKAAGINFDYKKLTDGCTKNKERVGKMMDLLIAAGLEGKPTMDKCRALKTAKQQKKDQAKQAKKEAKVKVKNEDEETETPSSRRMTRGATGVKPRQRIVISSDEEDDTPAARRTLSKLRSSVNDDSD